MSDESMMGGMEGRGMELLMLMTQFNERGFILVILLCMY